MIKSTAKRQRSGAVHEACPSHMLGLLNRVAGFPRLIETRSLPTLTHVLSPISTSRFAHLCRARPRGSIHSLLPSSLFLDHSHHLVLAPATLAALPSTRAIPNRDVFYLARPTRPIRNS